MSTQLDFGRPLSAGEQAKIHPGSLVVEFGLDRGAILDIDAGRQLTEALARRGEPTATRREVFHNLPEAVARFYATRAHEHDHLRRWLATSYGFLCDELRCQFVCHTAVLFAEAAKARGGFLTPLLSTAPYSGATAAEIVRSISATASATAETGLAARTRGLIDLLGALEDDVPLARLASALWALGVDVQDLLRDSDKTYPGCAAHPMIDPSGCYRGLSARHLLELFAIGEHGNAFLRLGASLADVEGLLRDSRGEYATALLGWYSLFPAHDFPSPTDQPRGEDDLIFDWYRLFPFELFVAADLSLWPPYFPDGTVHLARPLEWGDLNPGRRFVKALSAFQRLGVTPGVIPATARNERFLELQAAACRELGWPTPEDLAAQWLANLEDHERSGTSPWSATDGPSRYRVRNAGRLLRERGRRPADFVLNNTRFGELPIQGSPGWIFSEVDGRQALVPMTEDGEMALYPLFTIEGARQLCTRDRLLFGGLHASEVRRTGCEVVGNHFAALAGWTPEVRSLYQEEGPPAFNMT